MGRHVRARCDVQSSARISDTISFGFEAVMFEIASTFSLYSRTKSIQKVDSRRADVLRACDALLSSRIRCLRTKPRVSLVSKVYFGKWPKMDLSTCSSDTRRPSCRLLQRSLLTSKVLWIAVSAFAWFLLEARDPCFAVVRQRCTSQLATAGKCDCSCVRSLTAQWSQVCPLNGVTRQFHGSVTANFSEMRPPIPRTTVTANVRESDC